MINYIFDDNDLNMESGMQSVDKRRSRNENEKKRRDQFNDLIDKLGSLLNHEHKTDKSTTLLETMNFFKSYSLINGKKIEKFFFFLNLKNKFFLFFR